MSTAGVRWGRAIIAAIVAEVVLVAAAVLWVTVYSYVIDPGQPVAVYQRHAAASGPWVSVLTGLVVFYGLGRWWLRSVRTAIVWIAIYLIADAAILWAATAEWPGLPWWIVALSYLTKTCCGLVGAWHGERVA